MKKIVLFVLLALFLVSCGSDSSVSKSLSESIITTESNTSLKPGIYKRYDFFIWNSEELNIVVNNLKSEVLDVYLVTDRDADTIESNLFTGNTNFTISAYKDFTKTSLKGDFVSPWKSLSTGSYSLLVLNPKSNTLNSSFNLTIKKRK